MIDFKLPAGIRLPPLRAWRGTRPAASRSDPALVEHREFGSNPGQLRMFTHLPPVLADDPALVVVLHGCGQSAADYNRGAGWSSLADRYGFALLLPEQQRGNNPNGCFNWFLPDDTARGQGEAGSIRQMIDTAAAAHKIGRDRIFITGLSAGGAMTSAMLACYPDIFAGGAIVAGLPHGAAANVQQALASMYQSQSRPAEQWGALVRDAAPRHAGPWPRISVWHGDDDKTVVPSNAGEIVKQWTNIHGLNAAPSRREIVDGYPREVWLGRDGEELIESYTIANMAHGTPLKTGESDQACGVAGPFLLDVGISSSYHIAKFFGIAGPGLRLPDAPRAAPPAAARPPNNVRTMPPPQPASGRLDIGGVIAKALTAAGLMKRD